MKLFEQAQLNFKKSNFFKAVELFEKSLKEEPLSVEQKILSCESIQKINESLNREDSYDQLLLLGKSYLDSNGFEKAAHSFHKLYKKTNDPYYLEREFSCLIKGGQVQAALELSSLLFEEFSFQRLSDDILRFVQENSSFLSGKIISLNIVRASVLAGNKGKLEEEIRGWIERSYEERRELVQLLIDLTSHNTKYWHSSELIRQIIWNEITQDDASYLVSKKWLVKFVMDYWLTQEIKHEVIAGTILLSKKYGLSILGHELAKFLGDEELADSFLMSMPREALMSDNFDFASDLLESSQDTEEERIEKNIKFFLSTKNKTEALKQAYRLEKVNPEHPLVQSLIPKNTASPTIENQKVINDLLTEIGKYSKVEQESYDYEASFTSMIKYYSQDSIQKDYEDMIIGFNLLGLHAVSLELIKKVNIETMKEQELVNFYYLKIETLIKSKKYYQARDVAEDILMTLPLIDSEKLTFEYLRGETYYLLGFKDIALSIFKSVKSYEDNYRLTEERIRSIEKDK